MILLTTKRVDIYGRVEFEIEGEGVPRAITTRGALHAAKVLAQLGVENPLRLVEHAREWGSVEIHKPE